MSSTENFSEILQEVLTHSLPGSCQHYSSFFLLFFSLCLHVLSCGNTLGGCRGQSDSASHRLLSGRWILWGIFCVIARYHILERSDIFASVFTWIPVNGGQGAHHKLSSWLLVHPSIHLCTTVLYILLTYHVDATNMKEEPVQRSGVLCLFPACTTISRLLLCTVCKEDACDELLQAAVTAQTNFL